MVDYDQEITIKWTNSSKKHYESLGYVFTGKNTEFKVKIKDLTKGSHAEIPITCDFCGDVFHRSYGSYNNSDNEKDACLKRSCRTKKINYTRVRNKQKERFQKLQKASEDMGYKLIYDPTKLYRNHDQIEYECPKHGIQSSLIGNYLKGHGCKECGRIATGLSGRHNVETVKKTIESYNNNILLNPEDYKNAHENNLHILCGLCKEHIFTMSYHNYRFSTHRCKFCCRKMSNAELTIHNILNNHNINYKSEKSFEGCVDKQPLLFDFYIPKYNLCIEFDGEQHYNSNYYETMFKDKEKGKQAFKECQKRDGIKDKYCEKHDINLLRIPYWKEKHLEEIIMDEIKKFE